MANRVIRDWTTSEKMEALSLGAEVFFTRLIMKADDYGSFHSNPKLIKAALFPLKDYSLKQVDGWLNECIEATLIGRYEVDGKQYIRIFNFGQRLQNMRNAFPQPIGDLQYSTVIHGDSLLETKRNEVEEETETNGAGKPASLTVEERRIVFRDKVAEHLNSYTKEMCRAFFDYWTEMNEGGRRMRFEMEKVFDISKRLKTWHGREKSTSKGGRAKETTSDLAKAFAERVSQDIADGKFQGNQ